MLRLRRDLDARLDEVPSIIQRPHRDASRALGSRERAVGKRTLMDTATVGLLTKVPGRGQLISSAPRFDAWALSCELVASRPSEERGPCHLHK